QRAGAEAPPIRRVFLVRSLEDPTPASTVAPAPVLDLVAAADLVCFPVGSFFTSVLAALLPDGIAEAVAVSRAPKVYVPNPGGDPEERGMSLSERVRALRSHLLRGVAGTDAALQGPAAVLDAVLVDAGRAAELELEPIRRMGTQVVRAPLRSPHDPQRYEGAALCNALEALLTLAPSGPPAA
ncbi:MAG: hypothetical protein FIA95_15710, partial [Gemmatimonadetes bacterium]|nr:hypothetical protein [Gemmatimonadota bacterium]